MNSESKKFSNFSKVKYVLMDIEGTIADINFVKKVLFPYSAREMRNFLSTNKSNTRVLEALKGVGGSSLEENIIQLLEWIASDVKHPSLKTLQGMIWKKGFENKTFAGHLYSDVVPAWDTWRAKGLSLGIYSSGSEDAQRLYFEYSEQGDVRSYIEHYFDLKIGPKRETKSYQLISDVIRLPPGEILFLSDIEQELDAAQSSGMETAQLIRGETCPSKHHNFYSSLNEIQF